MKEKVIVYFFRADWCRSCDKLLKPFRELKREMEDERVNLYEIDVETENGVEMSIQYEVRNVPTIVIVKRWKVVERISGTRTKQELKSIIEKCK